MAIPTDNYLEALVSTLTPVLGPAYEDADHLCLVHVPSNGAETVYHLAVCDHPVLTVSRLRHPLWPDFPGDGAPAPFFGEPESALAQVRMEWNHPFFGVVNDTLIDSCANYGDGRPGLDYYLLMGRLANEPFARESWEPYGRLDRPWMTLISAMQVAAKAAIARSVHLQEA